MVEFATKFKSEVDSNNLMLVNLALLSMVTDRGSEFCREEFKTDEECVEYFKGYLPMFEGHSEFLLKWPDTRSVEFDADRLAILQNIIFTV